MGKLFFPSSSLIIFIFLCVTKLATSQSPLVSQFCHKHIQDPNFCMKVVGSDPGLKTAKSIHDLETLTIELASKFSRALIKKCSSLLQSEEDPKIKSALGSCTGAYGLLSLNFDSMRATFQSGRPIEPQVLQARTFVSKCNHDFDVQKLKSPLAKDNDDMLKYIQIIEGNAV